jgi:uncharacterized caspase-like protein
MRKIQKITVLQFTLALLAILCIALAPPAYAQTTEKRMALVIGNGAYPTAALATPANDAGLIAQTLQAAGFDVVGARDLDEDSLRHAFRDFVDNVSKAGPDTVVALYFAGYGLQLEGENYLVPIDADISRDADVPVRALRLSDYTRALAALHLKATMVVLDAARASPFSLSGQPLAGGLALMEPEPGTLIAFNAAPGTVATDGRDGYGPYAKALAEMIRAGGLSPADLFDRVRLRVNEVTQGAQVPWDSSKIDAPFVFFERGPDAPPPAAPAAETASIRSRPIHDFGAQDAYLAALERDTIDAYEDFLHAYPDDPMARRVRALVAARREAVTWRRTYDTDSPEAYWSYLRRYPRGAHAADARRRLAQIAAALEPPPRFAVIDYGVPPPPPDEVVYYERPVLDFDDPSFGFAPPPPPPVYFLERPPPEFVVLAPPPPPFGAFILPVPVFVPVPVYVSAPAYVAPPRNPIIFNNIHNTVIINNTTNLVTITNPKGQVVSATPTTTPTGKGSPALTPVALAPALPPSVAPKAALLNSRSPPGSGTNPANLQTIKLPPDNATTSTTGALAPTTGNKSLPIPPAAISTPEVVKKPEVTTKPTATLSTPPITDKKVSTTPSVVTPSGPDTGKKPELTTRPTATLSTPPTDKVPLSTVKPVTTLSAPENGKKPELNTKPSATLSTPPADKVPLSTVKPVTTLSAPETGKKPELNTKPSATLSTPPTDKVPLSTVKPVTTLSAPETGKKLEVTKPTATLPTPPTDKKPLSTTGEPKTVNNPTTPNVVHLTPPSAPVVHQPPPPPPPPVVRQVQTPPPPPPPPPHPPAPPVVAKPTPKCVVVNGKQACK